MNNKLKFLFIGAGMILFFLFPMEIPKALAYYASEETLAARAKARGEVRNKYPELAQFTQAERLRRQQAYIEKMKEVSAPMPSETRLNMKSPAVSTDNQKTTRFVWQTVIPLTAIAGLVGIIRARHNRRANT